MPEKWCVLCLFIYLPLNLWQPLIFLLSPSVQFSRLVVSDSLQPHGLQHDRLPFPSPSPRACSDSSPLSWWCHPTISFSVVPFSSCLQSFPVLGFFLMSQLFASGSQKIGASASNDYSGLISFRIDWFDLLAVQVTLKSLLQHHSSKVSILPCSAFIVHLSFRYMTTGKTIALTIWTFVSKLKGKGTQSHLTLSDPMDCSTPGFLVYHQPLELAQTHVPRVGDAIQASHFLSSPSPPAFNLSQHQGLFLGVSSSHRVT